MDQIMDKQPYSSVVDTYISMFDSPIDAIRHVCTKTNRKYNDNYLYSWPKSKTRVPIDVVAYMQDYSFDYICKLLEINMTKSQARTLKAAVRVPLVVKE